MYNPIYTRNEVEAEEIANAACAARGTVERWGRIEETLMGATVSELELGGRPIFRVNYEVWSWDPMVDGGLPLHVRDARAEYSKRSK